MGKSKDKDVSVKNSKESTPSRMVNPFEEMDRLFENFMGRGWMRPFHFDHPMWSDWTSPIERKLLPRVDVIERDKVIVVRAQVPGVEKKDLSVTVTDNMVTIKGETSHETKEEKGDYFRRECSHGSFTRTIPLPHDVDGSQAKASFKDGMLELTVPKVDKPGKREVPIE